MDNRSPPPFLDDHALGVVLNIFVQPKSSRNMISGTHGNSIKIRLTAPPVDGAANRMCVDFIAKTLQVPRSSIEILSGHSSRNKRLLIKTDDPEIREAISARLRNPEKS